MHGRNYGGSCASVSVGQGVHYLKVEMLPGPKYVVGILTKSNISIINLASSTLEKTTSIRMFLNTNSIRLSKVI